MAAVAKKDSYFYIYFYFMDRSRMMTVDHHNKAQRRNFLRALRIEDLENRALLAADVVNALDVSSNAAIDESTTVAELCSLLPGNAGDGADSPTGTGASNDSDDSGPAPTSGLDSALTQLSQTLSTFLNLLNNEGGGASLAGGFALGGNLIGHLNGGDSPSTDVGTGTGAVDGADDGSGLHFTPLLGGMFVIGLLNAGDDAASSVNVGTDASGTNSGNTAIDTSVISDDAQVDDHVSSTVPSGASPSRTLPASTLPSSMLPSSTVAPVAPGGSVNASPALASNDTSLIGPATTDIDVTGNAAPDVDSSLDIGGSLDVGGAGNADDSQVATVNGASVDGTANDSANFNGANAGVNGSATVDTTGVHAGNLLTGNVAAPMVVSPNATMLAPNISGQAALSGQTAASFNGVDVNGGLLGTNSLGTPAVGLGGTGLAQANSLMSGIGANASTGLAGTGLNASAEGESLMSGSADGSSGEPLGMHWSDANDMRIGGWPDGGQSSSALGNLTGRFVPGSHTDIDPQSADIIYSWLA